MCFSSSAVFFYQGLWDHSHLTVSFCGFKKTCLATDKTSNPFLHSTTVEQRLKNAVHEQAIALLPGEPFLMPFSGPTKNVPKMNDLLPTTCILWTEFGTRERDRAGRRNERLVRLVTWWALKTLNCSFDSGVRSNTPRSTHAEPAEKNSNLALKKL